MSLLKLIFGSLKTRINHRWYAKERKEAMFVISRQAANRSVLHCRRWFGEEKASPVIVIDYYDIEDYGYPDGNVWVKFNDIIDSRCDVVVGNGEIVNLKTYWYLHDIV